MKKNKIVSDLVRFIDRYIKKVLNSQVPDEELTLAFEERIDDARKFYSNYCRNLKRKKMITKYSVKKRKDGTGLDITIFPTKTCEDIDFKCIINGEKEIEVACSINGNNNL
ncbi:hypothetical protein M0R36_10770 [bacterium]|jgi:hypothetical protein|nr:hypothetical protein [bacterium]